MSSHIGSPSNKKNYHQLKGAYSTSKTFADDFVKMLKAYTSDVVDGIDEEVENTANDGCELLQKTRQPQASESGSAKPMKRREWKRYANSWAVKQTGGENSNFIRCTIHNKIHYRLTHLLEYGHATRDGNHTRAFRHIEPVELYCTNRLEKNIPKIIEKGGKLWTRKNCLIY